MDRGPGFNHDEPVARAVASFDHVVEAVWGSDNPPKWWDDDHEKGLIIFHFLV